MRKRETVFSYLSILGSVIGGAGLILLSIFDTKRHTSLHRAFLLVFIVGVALSAIFSIVEFRWISRSYAQEKQLKIAYIAKAVIAFLLIVLAIAFGITLYNNNNAGAILEWIIAFGFTFYLLSFAYDLRLSKNRHNGEFSKERLTTAHQTEMSHV
ncbi:hypothetical protein EW146_g235 [Bondarzewia mesenterica]|uniref:CWH43-like N-terminal domain-containing protein n=1 Tax=Bondarzewia mesenterica TaxID=1095465 RepID=A0A4S4M7V5_9AGAM|nr:hypothetical protein EW146_g235 [Bondarzewia mesenterica]